MAMKSKSIPLIAAFSISMMILLVFSSQAQATPARPSAEASAATWPTLSTTQIATDLVSPVLITHAGDSSGRIFIVEQIGRIRIFTNNLVNQPFLDIQGQVQYSGEQGLLGLAFPPDYASKGYFYVYYTNTKPLAQRENIVSRFHIGNSPNQADPNSEEIILPNTAPGRNQP